MRNTARTGSGGEADVLVLWLGAGALRGLFFILGAGGGSKNSRNDKALPKHLAVRTNVLWSLNSRNSTTRDCKHVGKPRNDAAPLGGLRCSDRCGYMRLSLEGNDTLGISLRPLLLSSVLPAYDLHCSRLPQRSAGLSGRRLAPWLLALHDDGSDSGSMMADTVASTCGPVDDKGLLGGEELRAVDTSMAFTPPDRRSSHSDLPPLQLALTSISSLPDLLNTLCCLEPPATARKPTRFEDIPPSTFVS
mmetsp:Transcript_4785/g.8224  ORF Transcript_4785/g.8224 Transcript_4785/m.8224 type:complete len:248 (+) Transcript_4785:354-1097(+)